MEVELFVHGVPNGEGFWGKEEDRNYFGIFYDHSSDEVKFLIQTRSFKGQSYCYYNYLVYKSAGSSSPNVVGYDGRDGSYFGISLRLDAYCKDIINMYRILDTVYNVYVLGNLLKMEKTKLKYTTPDFASVSATLEAIEKDTIQLIQKAFSNESFVKLDGFVLSVGNYPTFNLYDCAPDVIQSAIKQCSKVLISPYYPSGKEVAIQQQCNAQIQVVQQQCDSRLKADTDIRTKEMNEMSLSLASTKSQLSQLQLNITQKEGAINQLNTEITRLKSELAIAGKNKKIAQIVAPLKEPITELAAALQQIVPQAPEAPERINHGTRDPLNDSPHQLAGISKIKRMKLLLPFLNFFLLLIIGGTLLYPFMGKKVDDAKKALQEKVDSLENANKELQKQVEAAKSCVNKKEAERTLMSE